MKWITQTSEFNGAFPSRERLRTSSPSDVTAEEDSRPTHKRGVLLVCLMWSLLNVSNSRFHKRDMFPDPLKAFKHSIVTGEGPPGTIWQNFVASGGG